MGPTLVVLVGPSGSGKTTFAKAFAPQEVVSTDALRQELADDLRRQDMNDVVMNEFDRRLSLRLELGKRAVADATHLRDTARKRTARLAAKYGAKLVYVVVNRSLPAKLAHAEWRAGVKVGGKDLIIAHEETFCANEAKILNGDGLGALVIDTRKTVPDIVLPLRRDPYGTWPVEQAPLHDILSRGYRGLLVVGDIHGNVEGLRKMIARARSERLFLLSLGDIVDYAPGTLETAEIMADVVFDGEGAAVLGNHERKILRWVQRERIEGVYTNENGFTGELSEGNAVTVNQLAAMTDQDRLRWETRFFGLCDLMPHFYRMPRYLFAHGAATRRMFEATEFRFSPNTIEESYAVFGETTGKFINGFPERIYDWVDAIPPRMTVVVGHDCRCQTYPLVQVGAAGGRALFLDTGSSKPDRFPDGRLSGLALDIEHQKKEGHVLVNERVYTDHDL